MPEVGAVTPPPWVELVRGLYDPALREAIPVCAYSPLVSIQRQMNPVMDLILNQINPAANPAAASFLSKKPWLAQPPGKELAQAASGGYRTIGATDVQLYMLLRATHIFVDLEDMVGMGTSIPLVLGDSLGATCVGIGASFAINPWLDRYLTYKIHPSQDAIRKIVWG